MGIKFDRGLYRNGNHAKGMSYGQIEENQVWFNRAGMIEAQCYLDPECFSDVQVGPNVKYEAETTPGADDAVKIVAQNGAFLMIDKANKLATIPNQEMSDAGFPMGINYSTEKIYNQFAPQRRNFFLTTSDWLPRIGYTQVGMRITTNTVQWAESGTIENEVNANLTINLGDFAATADSADFYVAIKNFLTSGSKTPIYAVVTADSDGELVIGADPADALGNVYCQLVKAYDNADRTVSFMFQFINKPEA